MHPMKSFSLSCFPLASPAPSYISLSNPLRRYGHAIPVPSVSLVSPVHVQQSPLSPQCLTGSRALRTCRSLAREVASLRKEQHREPNEERMQPRSERRAQAENDSLQRIYGVSFPSAKQLKACGRGLCESTWECMGEIRSWVT